MELQRADWELPADPRSVATARMLLSRRLAELPVASTDLVLLLTSELVGNAVRHGAGPVGVHAAWGAGVVLVEVEDRSRHWPVIRAPSPHGLSGRGLVIVDELSTGWGVRPTTTGKTVWFTVDARGLGPA